MTSRTVWAALAGGTMTALLLLGWARLQRWRHRDHENAQSLTELGRRFRRWEQLGVVLLLASVALAWIGLPWLSAAVPLHADAVRQLGAGRWHWAAAAFCVGNLFATAPTHFLFQWWMGPVAYGEFRAYQARKFGFDSRRWLVVFYVVFGAATARFIWLLLGWGVAFTPSEVVLSPFWKADQYRYGYERIMEVRIAEGERGLYLALQFDDGRWWNSAAALLGTTPAEIEQAAAYVSAQSGLPVVRH